MPQAMTDMANTPEEAMENYSLAAPEPPKYPYGLQINLGQKELSKLGVDYSGWEIGDSFALDIIVKVIGKNLNEREGGTSDANICLQITHIGAEEADEPEETDEMPLEKHGYLRYGK
mgnify:CR=1 FL=1